MQFYADALRDQSAWLHNLPNAGAPSRRATRDDGLLYCRYVGRETASIILNDSMTPDFEAKGWVSPVCIEADWESNSPAFFAASSEV